MLQQVLRGVEDVGLEVELETAFHRLAASGDIGVVGFYSDGAEFLLIREEMLVKPMHLLPNPGQAEEEAPQYPLRPCFSLPGDQRHATNGPERAGLAGGNAPQLQVADQRQLFLALFYQAEKVDVFRRGRRPETGEMHVLLGVGKRVQFSGVHRDDLGPDTARRPVEAEGRVPYGGIVDGLIDQHLRHVMQPVEHFQKADARPVARHRNELLLGEGASRWIGGEHLGQHLGPDQDIGLQDHPPDHVLGDAIVVDIENIETGQPSQAAVRLRFGNFQGRRGVGALHDIDGLLTRLALGIVFRQVFQGVDILGIHQIIEAGLRQPLDLVHGRVVHQDDVRGAVGVGRRRGL